MACNDCHPLASIPECTNEMVLGNIAVNTQVYIYVENLVTGYIHRQEALSDNTGEVILDLSEPDPSFYNQNSSYEVWVTLRTDNVRMAVTVGADLEEEAVDCIDISFYKAMDTATL